VPDDCSGFERFPIRYGKVKIVKLNVEKIPVRCEIRHHVDPTLMLFKNGQLASRQVGAQRSKSSSSGSLLRMTRDVIPSRNDARLFTKRAS